MRRTSSSTPKPVAIQEIASFVKTLAFDDVRYRLAMQGLGLADQAPAYKDAVVMSLAQTNKGADHVNSET